MSMAAAMADNASRMGYSPYTPDMGMGYGYASQFTGHHPPYSGYPRPSHLADPYHLMHRRSCREKTRLPSPYPMPRYNMHAPAQLGGPSYSIDAAPTAIQDPKPCSSRIGRIFFSAGNFKPGRDCGSNAQDSSKHKRADADQKVSVASPACWRVRRKKE